MPAATRAQAPTVQQKTELPPEAYRQAVDQADLAISITDPRANILFANEAFTRVTGYSAEEIIGKNESILSNHTSPDALYHEMWRALSGQRPWSGKLLNRRKDGELYLAELTISPVVDGSGKTTHFLGMHRDVTELHRLERVVRNQKNLIESVVDAAPIAFALLDQGGRVILDNQEYKKLVSDLRVKEPAHTLLDSLLPLWTEALGSAPAQCAFASREARIDRIGGRPRWLSVSASVIEMQSDCADSYFCTGGNPGLLLVISDVSSLREEQERARAAAMQAVLADEERTAAIREGLSAAIFRLEEPMNVMASAAAILQRRDPAGAEALQQALAANYANFKDIYTRTSGKPYDYDAANRKADKPTENLDLSFGGPLGKNGGFFYTGKYARSYGPFPNQFSQTLTNSLKLHTMIGDKLKLVGFLMIEDGGLMGGWTNRDFAGRYKLFANGIPQNKRLGVVGYGSLTHFVSPKTFYEIKVSEAGRTSEFGFSDDNNNGVVEMGENGKFIRIDTQAQSDLYFKGTGTATGKAFFNPNPGNEGTFETKYAGGNIFRMGQPGFFYEKLKRSNMTFKLDLTSQVEYHNQIKAGFQFRRHTVSDFRQENSVTPSYDANFPFYQIDYTLHPREMALYAQDRIEYEGIIINAGIRLDSFNPEAKDYADYTGDLSVITTLANGKKILDQSQARTKATTTTWFWSPRVGISHPVSSKAAMHYSWGKFFTPPVFTQIFESYGVLPNSSLPVLYDVNRRSPTATQYEIGIQWSFFKDFATDVTAYYRDIDHYSDAGFTLSPRAGQPGGIGSVTYITDGGYADARGIEVSLEKRPSNYWSARLSYTFSYVKGGSASGTGISNNRPDVTAYSVAAGALTGTTFQQVIGSRDRFSAFSRDIAGGGTAFDSGFDRTHRFTLTTLFTFPHEVDFSSITTAASGFFYTKTYTSTDPRAPTIAKSPYTLQTDLRLTKGLKVSKHGRANAFLEVRNLFGRKNILTWNSIDIPSSTLWEQKQDPTGTINMPARQDGTPIYDIARQTFFGISYDF